MSRTRSSSCWASSATARSGTVVGRPRSSSQLITATGNAKDPGSGTRPSPGSPVHLAVRRPDGRGGRPEPTAVDGQAPRGTRSLTERKATTTESTPATGSASSVRGRGTLPRVPAAQHIRSQAPACGQHRRARRPSCEPALVPGRATRRGPHVGEIEDPPSSAGTRPEEQPGTHRTVPAGWGPGRRPVASRLAALRWCRAHDRARCRCLAARFRTWLRPRPRLPPTTATC